MPKYGKRRSTKQTRRKKPWTRGARRGGRSVITSSLSKAMPKGFLSSYNDFNPFPLSLYTKLVYTGTGELQSAAGFSYSGTSENFRLNSPYDPYTGAITASWNQGCYNFGKLLTVSGPYTRYKVNGVMIDILLYDSKGTDSDSNELIIKINNSSESTTAGGIVAYNVEKLPMVKVVRLADSGSQRRNIKQYIPMHQLFGMTKEQYRADRNNTTGPYNGNPGSVPTLSIALANARSAATATSMLIRLKLTYFVELYERFQDVY